MEGADLATALSRLIFLTDPPKTPAIAKEEEEEEEVFEFGVVDYVKTAVRDIERNIPEEIPMRLLLSVSIASILVIRIMHLYRRCRSHEAPPQTVFGSDNNMVYKWCADTVVSAMYSLMLWSQFWKWWGPKNTIFQSAFDRAKVLSVTEKMKKETVKAVTTLEPDKVLTSQRTLSSKHLQTGASKKYHIKASAVSQSKKKHQSGKASHLEKSSRPRVERSVSNSALRSQVSSRREDHLKSSLSKKYGSDSNIYARSKSRSNRDISERSTELSTTFGLSMASTDNSFQKKRLSDHRQRDRSERGGATRRKPSTARGKGMRRNSGIEPSGASETCLVRHHLKGLHLRGGDCKGYKPTSTPLANTVAYVPSRYIEKSNKLNEEEVPEKKPWKPHTMAGDIKPNSLATNEATQHNGKRNSFSVSFFSAGDKKKRLDKQVNTDPMGDYGVRPSAPDISLAISPTLRTPTVSIDVESSNTLGPQFDVIKPGAQMTSLPQKKHALLYEQECIHHALKKPIVHTPSETINSTKEPTKTNMPFDAKGTDLALKGLFDKYDIRPQCGPRESIIGNAAPLGEMTKKSEETYAFWTQPQCFKPAGLSSTRPIYPERVNILRDTLLSRKIREKIGIQRPEENNLECHKDQLHVHDTQAVVPTYDVNWIEESNLETVHMVESLRSCSEIYELEGKKACSRDLETEETTKNTHVIPNTTTSTMTKRCSNLPEHPHPKCVQLTTLTQSTKEVTGSKTTTHHGVFQKRDSHRIHADACSLLEMSASNQKLYETPLKEKSKWIVQPNKKFGGSMRLVECNNSIDPIKSKPELTHTNILDKKEDLTLPQQDTRNRETAFKKNACNKSITKKKVRHDVEVRTVKQKAIPSVVITLETLSSQSSHSKNHPKEVEVHHDVTDTSPLRLRESLVLSPRLTKDEPIADTRETMVKTSEREKTNQKSPVSPQPSRRSRLTRSVSTAKKESDRARRKTIGLSERVQTAEETHGESKIEFNIKYDGKKKFDFKLDPGDNRSVKPNNFKANKEHVVIESVDIPNDSLRNHDGLLPLKKRPSDKSMKTTVHIHGGRKLKPNVTKDDNERKLKSNIVHEYNERKLRSSVAKDDNEKKLKSNVVREYNKRKLKSNVAKDDDESTLNLNVVNDDNEKKFKPSVITDDNESATTNKFRSHSGLLPFLERCERKKREMSVLNESSLTTQCQEILIPRNQEGERGEANVITQKSESKLDIHFTEQENKDIIADKCYPLQDSSHHRFEDRNLKAPSNEDHQTIKVVSKSNLLECDISTHSFTHSPHSSGKMYSPGTQTLNRIHISHLDAKKLRHHLLKSTTSSDATAKWKTLSAQKSHYRSTKAKVDTGLRNRKSRQHLGQNTQTCKALQSLASSLDLGNKWQNLDKDLKKWKGGDFMNVKMNDEKTIKEKPDIPKGRTCPQYISLLNDEYPSPWCLKRKRIHSSTRQSKNICISSPSEQDTLHQKKDLSSPLFPTDQISSVKSPLSSKQNRHFLSKGREKFPATEKKEEKFTEHEINKDGNEQKNEHSDNDNSDKNQFTYVKMEETPVRSSEPQKKTRKPKKLSLTRGKEKRYKQKNDANRKEQNSEAVENENPEKKDSKVVNINESPDEKDLKQVNVNENPSCSTEMRLQMFDQSSKLKQKLKTGERINPNDSQRAQGKTLKWDTELYDATGKAKNSGSPVKRDCGLPCSKRVKPGLSKRCDENVPKIHFKPSKNLEGPLKEKETHNESAKEENTSQILSHLKKPVNKNESPKHEKMSTKSNTEQLTTTLTNNTESIPSKSRVSKKIADKAPLLLTEKRIAEAKNRRRLKHGKTEPEQNKKQMPKNAKIRKSVGRPSMFRKPGAYSHQTGNSDKKDLSVKKTTVPTSSMNKSANQRDKNVLLKRQRATPQNATPASSHLAMLKPRKDSNDNDKEISLLDSSKLLSLCSKADVYPSPMSMKEMDSTKISELSERFINILKNETVQVSVPRVSIDAINISTKSSEPTIWEQEHYVGILQESNRDVYRSAVISLFDSSSSDSEEQTIPSEMKKTGNNYVENMDSVAHSVDIKPALGRIALHNAGRSGGHDRSISFSCHGGEETQNTQSEVATPPSSMLCKLFKDTLLSRIQEESIDLSIRSPFFEMINNLLASATKMEKRISFTRLQKEDDNTYEMESADTHFLDSLSVVQIGLDFDVAAPQGPIMANITDASLQGPVMANITDASLQGPIMASLTDASLQGPIVTNIADASLHGPIATNITDASLQGPIAANITDATLQGPIVTNIDASPQESIVTNTSDTSSPLKEFEVMNVSIKEGNSRTRKDKHSDTTLEKVYSWSDTSTTCLDNRYEILTESDLNNDIGCLVCESLQDNTKDIGPNDSILKSTVHDNTERENGVCSDIENMPRHKGMSTGTQQTHSSLNHLKTENIRSSPLEVKSNYSENKKHSSCTDLRDDVALVTSKPDVTKIAAHSNRSTSSVVLYVAKDQSPPKPYKVSSETWSSSIQEKATHVTEPERKDLQDLATADITSENSRHDLLAQTPLKCFNRQTESGHDITPPSNLGGQVKQESNLHNGSTTYQNLVSSEIFEQSNENGLSFENTARVNEQATFRCEGLRCLDVASQTQSHQNNSTNISSLQADTIDLETMLDMELVKNKQMDSKCKAKPMFAQNEKLTSRNRKKHPQHQQSKHERSTNRVHKNKTETSNSPDLMALCSPISNDAVVPRLERKNTTAKHRHGGQRRNRLDDFISREECRELHMESSVLAKQRTLESPSDHEKLTKCLLHVRDTLHSSRQRSVRKEMCLTSQSSMTTVSGLSFDSDWQKSSNHNSSSNHINPNVKNIETSPCKLTEETVHYEKGRSHVANEPLKNPDTLTTEEEIFVRGQEFTDSSDSRDDGQEPYALPLTPKLSFKTRSVRDEKSLSRSSSEIVLSWIDSDSEEEWRSIPISLHDKETPNNPSPRQSYSPSKSLKKKKHLTDYNTKANRQTTPVKRSPLFHTEETGVEENVNHSYQVERDSFATSPLFISNSYVGDSVVDFALSCQEISPNTIEALVSSLGSDDSEPVSCSKTNIRTTIDPRVHEENIVPSGSSHVGDGSKPDCMNQVTFSGLTRSTKTKEFKETAKHRVSPKPMEFCCKTRASNALGDCSSAPDEASFFSPAGDSRGLHHKDTISLQSQSNWRQTRRQLKRLSLNDHLNNSFKDSKKSLNVMESRSEPPDIDNEQVSQPCPGPRETSPSNRQHQELSKSTSSQNSLNWYKPRSVSSNTSTHTAPIQPLGEEASGRHTDDRTLRHTTRSSTVGVALGLQGSSMSGAKSMFEASVPLNPASHQIVHRGTVDGSKPLTVIHAQRPNLVTEHCSTEDKTSAPSVDQSDGVHHLPKIQEAQGFPVPPGSPRDADHSRPTTERLTDSHLLVQRREGRDVHDISSDVRTSSLTTGAETTCTDSTLQTISTLRRRRREAEKPPCVSKIIAMFENFKEKNT